MQSAIVDQTLLQRYDCSGPRYTSYPTALQFCSSFGDADYRRWVNDSNNDPIPSPLSLYFHIPFCNTVCYYCGCSKIVTRDKGQADNYVALLKKEIRLQGECFAGDRRVTQMHWGGGTPTFLDDDTIADILEEARTAFAFSDSPEAEYSIEADPRTVDPGRIARLREAGFNRISFGVQDFNPEVQQAVHRVQDETQIRENIDAARQNGFASINLDLMYGLPLQSADSFSDTLARSLSMAPDRIAVYNYAHLPAMFKPQRRIHSADLPSPQEKLHILQLTIDTLQQAGYVYIGMDHFAKKDDALVKAQNAGTLHRNFQGYSTHADCDIVAMGITAISSIGDNYAQNVKTLTEYAELLEQDRIPTWRGFELEPDDILRRQIINQLLCHFELDIPRLESEWQFDFMRYFDAALPALAQMEQDGLLQLDPQKLTITPTGRLLARNICMQFDRYLQERKAEEQYSRVI